jgi:hypothetical protein
MEEDEEEIIVIIVTWPSGELDSGRGARKMEVEELFSEFVILLGVLLMVLCWVGIKFINYYLTMDE